MATNVHFEEADQVAVPVPEGTESGDLLVIGVLPCVALIDRTSDGVATVKFNGAVRVEVIGQGSGGNAAIAEGEAVFLQNDGTVDADTGGDAFGHALGAVLSGATTEIVVKIGR